MSNAPAQDPSLVTAERITLLLFRTRLRSVAALARATGMDRATLSLKMHGHRRWYLDDLQLIARVLGTTVSYLIGESEQIAPANAGYRPISVDGIARLVL